ncbi:hypothetical protein O181_012805 [Austropuccinia psidii MF-1]|uniref:Reverse transcriptase Ty1/copia-type domain-containing protein n=1 Tax=Austropuccinia psidii MF-1 TaxID=1389203 RepID=A0A9Q3BXT0_9BASI|nr:hypothetical protein [Austropuccinia psidii MF-1]
MGATQVLGTRWVFTLKTNPKGEVIRNKAKLVVQGHLKIKEINFEETFALTPTFATLRSIFEIASEYKWKITTFDVTTAYLHSKIDEDIYVQPPPGITAKEIKVWKQNKALCGLKQARCCWWLHLKMILRTSGYGPMRKIRALIYTAKGA